jgi:DNA helicase-2/ATP-dependent DNA helicase PcrA
LRQQHLSPHDFEHYLQKGSDTLTAFLQQKYSTFTPQQKVEVSFAHQAVFVGKAHLTGSLDMIDIHDGAISVTDYKTGKASRTWTGKTDFEKIKLHKYKQQLMFYELLLQNSRDYSRYEIDGRYLQFVEPTQSGDIVHLDASFTPEECEHFSRLIEAVWKHITTLELPDTSNFESNYKGMLAFESWLLDERG